MLFHFNILNIIKNLITICSKSLFYQCSWFCHLQEIQLLHQKSLRAKDFIVYNNLNFIHIIVTIFSFITSLDTLSVGYKIITFYDCDSIDHINFSSFEKQMTCLPHPLLFQHNIFFITQVIISIKYFEIKPDYHISIIVLLGFIYTIKIENMKYCVK